MFTVVTELRCPCEKCCGELISDPIVEDFTSLREAIEAFREPSPDVEDGTEASSYPLTLESAQHAWIRRTGTVWGEGCEDAGGDAAWECSLHVNRKATASSKLRILRIAGAN